MLAIRTLSMSAALPEINRIERYSYNIENKFGGLFWAVWRDRASSRRNARRPAGPALAEFRAALGVPEGLALPCRATIPGIR